MTTTHKGSPDILFVVMPFAALQEPAIGVSTLKAAVVAAGFTARIRYFNLDFAAITGLNLYQQISRSFSSRSLVPDWIFSEALFGSDAPDKNAFIAHIIADYSRWEDGVPYGQDFGNDRNFSQYIEEDLLPAVLKVRGVAQQFIAYCVEEIMRVNARVVGFSSSSHMACSCLSAAKLLKSQPSPPLTIFGGANCHGEMGMQWLSSFPWIDYVCTGEGDHVLPEFLTRLCNKGDPTTIPGILSQLMPRSLSVPELPRDLDSIPIPDYSDYLEQLGHSPLSLEIGRPTLPLESSRGCWWGEHSQCVFCGNCRYTIPYRSKSPERVVQELLSLTKEGTFGFVSSVDDALDRKQINTVFPLLKRHAFPLPIFYQTRPNLTKEELLILFGGGVRLIQPGIESFSDRILSIMRKGGTGLQNIQLLRWSAEVGMGVHWNILYGFPGEPIEEYGRMAGMIPLLSHLQPPAGCCFISLKRFSPYWESPAEHGLTDIRPWPSYELLYPLPKDEIEGFAYFYGFEYADGRQPFAYSRELRRAVGQWIMNWNVPPDQRPCLHVTQHGSALHITDTRPCAVTGLHKLEGVDAAIYLLCDRISTREMIIEKMGPNVDAGDVWGRLESLVEKKIVLECGGRYVSLAVFVTESG